MTCTGCRHGYLYGTRIIVGKPVNFVSLTTVAEKTGLLLMNERSCGGSLPPTAGFRSCNNTDWLTSRSETPSTGRKLTPLTQPIR